MDLDLWGSNITTFSHQHGPLHAGAELKSQGCPEFDLMLQRVVYHGVKDGGQVDGENRWSSLATPSGLDIITNVLYNPQVTLEWQGCKDTKSSHHGKSNSMSPSAVCEASWETQAFHVNHISSASNFATGIEDSSETDTQVYEYTPITLIESPIPGNSIQHDLPHRRGPQPTFLQSQGQIVYEPFENSSWPSSRWCFDVEALSPTEHSCSHFTTFTPSDNSINWGSIDYLAQRSPVHHNSVSTDLRLTSTTSQTTYPSSPPSPTWSTGTMEGNQEPCSDSACGTPGSRRHAKDAFLVQSKRSGMSYREIRIKGHFKEAESTLRGRYRTLTKCREHRVRKPQWHEKDVSL